MTATRIADLVDQIRDVLAEQAGRPLPPILPPATEEEIAAVESALGYPLPTELRELYAIARGGYIGAIGVVEIDTIVDFTAECSVLIDEWDATVTPNHWYGQPPQGEIIAFGGGDEEVIYYEVGGPLAGRVVVWDFGASTAPVWGRLGDSLERCYEWQLAAARLGGFDVSFHQDGAHHYVTPLDSGDGDRFQVFLQQVRPAIAAAGATPAYFRTFDPPEGYITPTK